jgi:hypothetical protein
MPNPYNTALRKQWRDEAQKLAGRDVTPLSPGDTIQKGDIFSNSKNLHLTRHPGHTAGEHIAPFYFRPANQAP